MQNNFNLKRINNKKGFALLFSVLVSGLLLTIGLSILNISLKELSISTATRQSIYAFYAADSGREYVKYRDTKIGDASTFDVNFRGAQSTTDYIPSSSAFIPIDNINNPYGPNFYAEIKKEWADTTFSKINTIITSKGYDTVSGDRVERAIFQSY